MKASFISSYARFEDMPPSTTPEFCILGRSNVGKSSFINHMFADTSLAKVAKKPGKTILANSFKVENNTFWVDLPGYGYAKASQGEKQRFQDLLSTYCGKRPNLCGVLQLLDSRHPGLAIDLEWYTWLSARDIPVFPVLTKTDKLSNNERAANAIKFMQTFHFSEKPVGVSNVNNKTRDLFWERFTVFSERAVSMRRELGTST